MFLDQSIGEKPTSATSTKNLERLQTEFLIPRTLRNNSQAWLHFAMWHHLCLNYWCRAWPLQLYFLVCYAPSLYDKRFQFSGCYQHTPKHSIVFFITALSLALKSCWLSEWCRTSFWCVYRLKLHVMPTAILGTALFVVTCYVSLFSGLLG